MNRNGDEPAHPVLGAAEWIALAAAPTFAVMAVLTGTLWWRTVRYALLGNARCSFG